MKWILIISTVCCFLSCQKQKKHDLVQEHPNLILTVDAVKAIRSSLGQVPLFDESVETVRKEVDHEIALGINVPIPKDLAGGYSHERHKANFFTMQKAGVLFQITQEVKYAEYLRDMLLAYAKLYPTLGKHPATRSYARGKFFWQCLNDANWLVYAGQAYDCIYDWLDKKVRKKLNKNLFRPYAEYISIENPQFFNRIHNHSMWGIAGVGMIGLVMDDEELVDWALNGLAVKVPDNFIKDNDGENIQSEGKKEVGFFAQLDHAFSPDGYYTEGPYYQRYAMYPFLMFAQALSNKRPEIDIFSYRDKLLIKSVYALINQTNAKGEFFPFNDAQKGMSLASRELVNALSMAYQVGEKDAALLSIIETQSRVPLNYYGLASASGIAKGLSKKYILKSIEFKDGANGKGGAIGILRKGGLTLVMKYAKHGMGHGHFDRLGFLLYNNGEEVIQDYGSARWVNIEHKNGGGYLKENKSWAKQTIAHNTLVINNESHFKAIVDDAEKNYGTPYYFDAVNPRIKLVSAKEDNAYADVLMQRTMCILEVESLENPLVLDIFNVKNEKEANYDLPIYYMGELMSVNQNLETKENLGPLGEQFGYQHLWVEAESKVEGENLKMTWFDHGIFYSLTSTVMDGDEILLTRIGANDANFNLRRNPGLILRRKDTHTVFASLYETHGKYNASDEIPNNSFSSIKNLNILHESQDYAIIDFELVNNDKYLFAISLNDSEKLKNHSVQLSDRQFKWTGPYTFFKSN